MGKIILEFDSVEEFIEAQDAVNAHRWKGICWDLNQWFRSELKYNEDNLSESAYDAIEKASEKFHELLNDEGLKLL